MKLGLPNGLPYGEITLKNYPTAGTLTVLRTEKWCFLPLKNESVWRIVPLQR
jgi:hypothetical protein